MRKRNSLLNKLITIMALVILVSTTNLITLAAAPPENGTWEVALDEMGEIYLKNTNTGENMVAAYTINENGDIVYYDLTEYANHLNSMAGEYQQNRSTLKFPITGNEDTKIIAFADPAPTYTYAETRTYTGLAPTEKVTPDYTGPCTITLVNSVTTTEGFGGSLSGNADVAKSIKLGASFTWNTSSASATSVSGTWSVPAGKKGYIQFTPYLNVSVGNVTMYYWVGGVFKTLDMGENWGSSPKKVGNFTDGNYEIIIS